MSIRSEARTVRPFMSFSIIEECLQGTEFRVNDEVKTETVFLPQTGFPQAKYELTLSSGVEALAASLSQLGLNSSEYSLTIFASGRTFKSTFVLLRINVNEIDENFDCVRVFDANTDPFIFRDSLNGFSVTVAVTLNVSKPPQLLTPTVIGTWLAKKEFEVSPVKLKNTFTPLPITDEIRALHRVPEKSAVFCLVTNSLVDVTNLDDALEFYVDSETLSDVQLNPYGPTAKVIQAFWARTAVSALVHRTSQELKEVQTTNEELLLSDSILNQIVRNLHKKEPSISNLDFLKILRDDPELFITHFDSSINIIGFNRTALRGE